VRYDNGSDTPSTATRTVRFQVDDGQSVNNLSATGASSDKTVTVTATNDAPTISVADTTPLAYTENDPATPVNASGAVSVADVDSLAITGATVTFSGGAASGDVLDATVPGGFTKSFAGGVLTIGGTGSFSQYEDILESVTYASTSDNPSSAQRTLELVVDDGAAFNNLSTAATRRVDVANVNDAPVLTQPDGALTYTEDSPSAKHQLPIAPNLGATDADSANLIGATVKIGTNYVNGQDVLSVPGPLAGGITFTFNAASGTATLGGSASVADYQAALRSVRYQNTSDAPSENARTIEFRADDGASAAHASNLVTRDVGVVAVNDLPVAADMTFNGADSAIGNTTFVVNDPADGAPATPDPTDTSPVTDRPHKTVAGSILAGATDADGPNSPTVVPGTFATNDGGTVTIQSDGDFTFEPAPQTSCTDTSDFFDYTLTDGNTPTAGTDTGQVTIALSGCVRYVDNDDAQGNSGTSEKPYDTLAQAETASAAGDSIFVYAGDKTTNGYASGIDLKASQKLVGEAGALVVGADTLHAADASKRPTITDTANDAVVLAAGNLVRGLQIDPGSATGGGIAGGAGDDGGTIEDVRIIDTGAAGGQPGLELNGTSGTFNVSDLTVDNSAATSPPSTAKGVSLNGAGTVNFLSTGTISITTKGAAGLDADTTNMGSGSVFDDITVTGSGTGGVRMSNTTGTTQLGGGSGTDLDLTTSSGSAAALRINSGGTVSVPSSGTSNISATGGPAVDVSGTPGISLPLDGVSSTNSATNGISLAGLGSGTFSATTGAIAGAAGTAFSVSGGSGAITYPGNLNDGPGQTASITSRAGGTVTLSGQINDSSDAGGGITASNNTGGSTVFSNSTKTLNTTTGTAVLFNGGDGHTLTFSNGGLNIDTTSGSGIAASGLGAGSPRNALNVTGSGNTIDSTTGTALDVARTDVGGTPLTFQSISSNGAGNGIRLDDTGPNNALTVSSNGGGTCTAANASGCSGGVIQNSTGGDDTSTLPGGTGVALRNAKGVSLTRMHIVNSSNYGIRGSSVNGLALANSVIDGTNGTNAATANKDSSARFDNLTGTVSIGDTEMSGGFTSNLLVNNTAGTLNATLTNFKSGTLDSVGGDDAVQFEGLGSATNNVTVNTSTFTTATGDLLQYIGNGDGGGSLGISGSSFSNNEPTIANGGGGVTLSGGGRNSTTLNVQNSTFRDSQTAAITVVKSRDVGHSGSLTGTIDNNAIGIAGTPNSGSSGGSGIDATTFGAGNAKLTVTNNQIYQYNSSGLSFTAGGGVAETGQFSLHISGNTIANPGTNPSVTLFQGIRVNSGVAAGDAFDTCVDMGANTIAGSGDPANGGDWRLRASFAGMRVPGATNSSPTDDAGMTSYVQGRIGSGTGAAVRANGGTWSNAGAPCP
jgi:hypothetical protein